MGGGGDGQMGSKAKEEVIQLERRRAGRHTGGGVTRQFERRGAKTKRTLLFWKELSRKSNMLVLVTDKCRGQRERGCYSAGQKSTHTDCVKVNSLRKVNHSIR